MAEKTIKASLSALLFSMSVCAVASAQGAPDAPVPPPTAEPAPAPTDQPPPPPPAPTDQPPPPPPGPAQPPPPPGYGPPPPGPPVYGPPPPGYYGYPGEPPPPAPRGPDPTAHRHDGLFIRLGLGFAYQSLTSSATSGSVTVDGKIHGGGAMFEFMVGGTPAPGLVLGGALIGHSSVNPTVEFGGQSQAVNNTALDFSVLALMVQYYVDPESGFYLQGLVGYGSATYHYTENNIDYTSAPSTGAVGGIGLGYDFWIGDQWSVGPEARLMYASLAYKTNTGDNPSGVFLNSNGNVSETDKLVVPSIALTFTLH